MNTIGPRPTETKSLFLSISRMIEDDQSILIILMKRQKFCLRSRAQSNKSWFGFKNLPPDGLSMIVFDLRIEFQNQKTELILFWPTAKIVHFIPFFFVYFK